MTTSLGRWASAGLLVVVATGCAHQAPTTTRAGVTPAPHAGTAAAAFPTRQTRWTEADADFMTGMIGHHAQAVLMAGWAASHGASPAVQSLCERIVVGQRDEIALMQRWLGEWGKPVPAADARHDMMPGMEHMMMPGMLTAEQLIALDQARGVEWDRLFLVSMIRHHQGALTMVKDLTESPGAAQDDNVFKFISDMNADQTIEIERMTRMLAALPPPAAGQ